jgi:hypothetical protein
MATPKNSDRSDFFRNRCESPQISLSQYPVHLGVRNPQVPHGDARVGVVEPFGQHLETDAVLNTLEIPEGLEPENTQFSGLIPFSRRTAMVVIVNNTIPAAIRAIGTTSEIR